MGLHLLAAALQRQAWRILHVRGCERSGWHAGNSFANVQTHGQTDHHITQHTASHYDQPTPQRLTRSSAMLTVNWPLRFRNSLVPSSGSTHQLYW